MSRMSIRGSEYPIKKIFSDDFVFTIPLYQRAYSWTTEESEDMLEDLLRAMEGQEESIEELSPYFLGSIVLIKGDEPDAQVIDGQQRLTTLTMLLATLRTLLTSDHAEALTTFLCEKGNVVTGTPNRYRLTLRRQDADFFKMHIQDEYGIEKLKNLHEVDSESQRNLRDNTLNFIQKLQSIVPARLIRLTQFIVNRCFMIVVAVDTADLDSAYRIFSVLNNRGLNLSYPDILKAEVINAIPQEQQEAYAIKWDDIATSLGVEQFEELLYNMRSIYAREPMRRGLMEEFHAYVYHPGQSSNMTAQQFIDDHLIRYAYARHSIVKANFQNKKYYAEKEARTINSMFKLLNNMDHQHWIPPVLQYFYQNWRDPRKMVHFLQDIERLVVSFVVCRVPQYRRHDRYYEILDAMLHDEDLFTSDSPLQLTTRERNDTFRRLDGDIYLINRHMCRYTLLRLDGYLSEGSASYDHETVSVEHVLPQRPASDSAWRRVFSYDVHARYVNRLGNLVLLSRNKNSSAENFDFVYKKERYFTTEGGISPFVLTTQVLREQDWTPEIVQKRQERLMETLKKLWRL
jgi:uncharacterized protein with ParB-like and HNH nuclease domain